MTGERLAQALESKLATYEPPATLAELPSRLPGLETAIATVRDLIING